MRIPNSGILNQYFLAKIKYKIARITGRTENHKESLITAKWKIIRGR
jgi:hypothetical protein